jgi:putative membrane protein
VLNTLGLWDHLRLDTAAHELARWSLLLLVPALLVALVVIASVLAVAGYVVQNFGFLLVYTRADHAWHLRRGLFTTRETSIDASRMRGVSIGEPLGLRLVSGARLSAIVTGLARDERGSSILVPPAPRGVVAAVAADVLGSTEPVQANLVPHGTAARRRRFTRALALPVVLSAVVVVGIALAGLPAESWALVPVALAIGLALAVDRTRSLGHQLAGGYLVSRAGSLARRRVALETQAVIGWNFTSTWFQRRVGLTTLVATMAGGRQSVTVLDVPDDTATALADTALPGLVSQFLA